MHPFLIIFDETVIVSTQQVEQYEIEVEYAVSARGPYSDTICWPVALSAGNHTASVKIWTSQSQTYVYDWRFTVTN